MVNDDNEDKFYFDFIQWIQNINTASISSPPFYKFESENGLQYAKEIKVLLDMVVSLAFLLAENEDKARHERFKVERINSNT